MPCGGAPYGDNNLVFIANDWHTALLPVYLQVAPPSPQPIPASSCCSAGSCSARSACRLELTDGALPHIGSQFCSSWIHKFIDQRGVAHKAVGPAGFQLKP